MKMKRYLLSITVRKIIKTDYYTNYNKNKTEIKFEFQNQYSYSRNKLLYEKLR